MSLCQSVRYALGIYAICFLLNGISTTEDTVREKYTTASKAAIEPEGRALFNPRVDYNHDWTPVGPDPLKNDPTFDYVPPTSGNVRYWSESSESRSYNENQVVNNTGDKKNEILLLGVPIEHSVHLQSDHLPQPEVKSANRRSSPYYPSELSRVLTPPSIQAYMSSYDQNVHSSEYNHYYTSPPHHWNNDLPVTHSSDAYPEESASYVTVIRPKTNPNPYSSTIYDKNIRNPIYHSLAANVNSLEPVEKKTHWVQSLLQKEITYQPQPTTPQVIVAYSPKIYEPLSSTNINVKAQAPPSDTANIANSFAEPITTTTTTPIPILMTTDSFFSHYKQPVLPARGPMYLIIQGHSKVKTYGADHPETKPEKQEPKMVPVTVKEEAVVRHVVANVDSNGNDLRVKHLHKLHTPDIKTKARSTKPTKKAANSPMDSLLSLLDSSLASFGMNKETKNKPNERITGTTKISTIFGPTTIRTNI